MLILGVDPGTTNLGLAFFDTETHTIKFFHNRINFEKNKSTSKGKFYTTNPMPQDYIIQGVMPILPMIQEIVQDNFNRKTVDVFISESVPLINNNRKGLKIPMHSPFRQQSIVTALAIALQPEEVRQINAKTLLRGIKEYDEGYTHGWLTKAEKSSSKDKEEKEKLTYAQSKNLRKKKTIELISKYMDIENTSMDILNHCTDAMAMIIMYHKTEHLTFCS